MYLYIQLKYIDSLSVLCLMFTHNHNQVLKIESDSKLKTVQSIYRGAEASICSRSLLCVLFILFEVEHCEVITHLKIIFVC